MIEGGGSPTLSKAKEWLYQHHEASHKLLQIITDVCVDFLIGQVRAGAQVTLCMWYGFLVTIMITQLLQVFESHGGLLSAESFTTYCSPYLGQIVQRVKENLTKTNLPVVPMVEFLLI